MNITTMPRFNSNLIIACDISKDIINYVVKSGNQTLEDEIPNRTFSIKRLLKMFTTQGHVYNVRVIAEPTGVYHKNLFRIANSLGLDTELVSAESVAKMRVIETNDTGKTDIKDPHVIHSLASLGKTLKHRRLPAPYNLLRRWNKIYELADKNVVRSKAAVHTLIKELFPDFDKKKEFIFGSSGQALMSKYRYNPYRIARAGKKRFVKAMKQMVPRVKQISLDTVYDQAQLSAMISVDLSYIDIVEVELLQRWQDLQTHLNRKDQAREAMIILYKQACNIDPHLPKACKGFISELNLARVVAETGPISDFDTCRKLMRYSGFNLVERQSGYYRGKTRISKKGRRLIRKVLNLVILPLIRKKGIYGPYYHKKKETMPGTKAMAAVSRHFLRMLYSVYKNGIGFDADRMFICESQLKAA